MTGYVATKIMEVMSQQCRGRENAHTRAWIEERLRHWAIDISDRKVRNHYSGLPKCSCEDGLFIPIRTSEVLEYESYMRRNGRSEAEISVKISRIYAYYPGLRPAPKFEQLSLGVEANRI